MKEVAFLASLVLVATVAPLAAAAPTIANLPPGYVQSHTMTVMSCAPYRACTKSKILTLPDGKQIAIPKMKTDVAAYVCAAENMRPGEDGCPGGIAGMWQRALWGFGL